MTCSSYETPNKVVLDPKAQLFSPKHNAAVAANERIKHNAVVASNERIKEVTDYETELSDVE